MASAMTLLLVMWGLYSATRPSEDEVMEDFHASEGRAEDMLMDPLIRNSEIAAPAVIREVRDPEMNHRRYAIGFLGNERLHEALPVLRTILANNAEEDYYRADALESIFMINKGEGLALAARYAQANGLLGHVAKGLEDGSHRPSQRMYWKALFDYHD